VGGDGQTPFGYCTLSLQPAIDPVVSPSGHIYSRESIYEYLLTKKEELSRQKEAYEAQQKELQLKAEKAGPAAVAVNKFVDSQNSLSASMSLKRKRKESEIEEEERKRAIVACSQAIDKSEYAHNRNEMKRTSFWLPEFTPEGGAKIIQKVSSVRVRAVGAACDLDVFGVDCSPLNAPRARTPDGR
jgi:nitric oxide synthase-interacting protein